MPSALNEQGCTLYGYFLASTHKYKLTASSRKQSLAGAGNMLEHEKSYTGTPVTDSYLHTSSQRVLYFPFILEQQPSRDFKKLGLCHPSQNSHCEILQVIASMCPVGAEFCLCSHASENFRLNFVLHLESFQSTECKYSYC